MSDDPSRPPTLGPRSQTLAALALCCLLAHPAVAYDYSTAIYIEGEEDLYELYYAGLLEEEEFQILLELVHQPLDVNSATRDDLYDLPGISRTTADAIVKRREEVGPYQVEWELIEMPGVGEAVFEQIRPFLYNLPPVVTRIPVRGILQLRVGKGFEKLDPVEDDHPEKTHSIDDLGYNKLPHSYLRGRISVNRWLEAGIQAIVQEDTGSVHYDPESRDFVAKWGAPAFIVDKGFVSAKHDNGSGIAGSYSVGFGRRLTFDVTDRTDPHGWYRDLSISQTSNSYGMLGDFNSPQRLFGGAGRLTAIRFGRSSLDMTVFGSSRLHDLYQYHMGLPVCDSVDEDVSPRVYVHGFDGTYNRVGWMTLPNAYREDLVGGNFTFRINNRSHVGVTGYVGHIDKTTIDGVPDNQEWRFRYRMPNRDYFGAVGVDGRLGLGMLTLAGEYAHNDNNGNAGLVEVNLSRPRFDLDWVFRHYDTAYDNPHARGIAADDLYGGLRARDETGFRFKGWVMPWDFIQARALADVWRRHSLQTWNLRLYGKLDVSPTQELRFGGFVRWTNKDLLHNGRSRIYGGSMELEQFFLNPSTSLANVPDEEIEEGAGAKTQWGVQADVYYIPRTHITLYYQRTYEDTGKLYPRDDAAGPCEPWFQVGNFFWVKARVKPGKLTTITYRFKIGDEDVYGGRGGKWTVMYLQLDQKIGVTPKPRIKLQIRGSLGRTLSDPRADFYEDCRNAGVAQLNGTCLEVGADEEAIDLSEEEWYGHVWGGIEFRF